MPKGVFKRKPHTEETKKKISISHMGKKMSPFTEEHKKKLSESNKGKHIPKFGKDNPMYGKPGPNLGKKASEETREKMRVWRIANPNKKFKDTKIEIKVEMELKRREILYEKQVSLCKVALVDFYLPEYRIVIQCDGCYWHGCPECGRGIIDNIEKDIRQDSVLTFNGFNVYRFWEHEINESVEECINKLNLN